MNRLLQRQLRRTLGLADPDAFASWLGRVRLEGADAEEDARVRAQLAAWFDRVDETYDQHERDIDLRTRSLELSSAELNQANRRLRQDLAERDQTLTTLRGILSHLQDGEAERWAADAAQMDVQGLMRSIGALVSSHEQARRELALQKFALDQHAIVSITDADGVIVYANDRFCEISGFRREELLGRTHRVVKSRVHPRSFYDELWATIVAGRVWQGEVCNRAKGGSHYWVDATIVPSGGERGRPRQYISIRTDITARKLAEEQLRFAKDAAESANRAKSEFLANKSHEIRTPMNGNLGMTDLALATALDNEQRDYLTMARHSAEALLDILNDILDFSKIEAGKLRVENVAYDLHEMLRTTVRTMALRADPDRVTVSVDLDPTLPQVVVGDPGRFRQVVVNLVGNAIKFTQRGSVSLEARAEPTPEGWRVVVAVADSGIGIREDKLSTIFDAFAQADSSTTRRYGGTGLGLSICKQLTALLGGEIGVTSEVGKGSRFTFDVRVRRPEPGEVPLSPSRGAVVPSVRPQRALRVLLVEDNIVNQRLALALLSRGGHEVVLARDGLEAVEAASRGEIDVILMDMQMPVLGGIEATERIRAEERREGRRRIPILALSAAAMQGDREAGLAAGMDDYLTKPVRAAELEACLRRFGGG
ncbi:MAG: hypothetical protein RLZZ383_2823 [Pseudomonadota bacterium]